MRIPVEVIGRPLALPYGACYGVGERLALDTENPAHRQVIAAGWVRQVAVPVTPAVSVTAAPPAHKMTTQATVKGKAGRAPAVKAPVPEETAS